MRGGGRVTRDNSAMNLAMQTWRNLVLGGQTNWLPTMWELTLPASVGDYCDRSLQRYKYQSLKTWRWRKYGSPSFCCQGIPWLVCRIPHFRFGLSHSRRL